MPDTYRISRSWLAFVGFALVAAFFLFTEHRAHLFGIVPYLFLLLCPLLHLIGHGHDHGGHANGRQPDDSRFGSTHDHGSTGGRTDWRAQR